MGRSFFFFFFFLGKAVTLVPTKLQLHPVGKPGGPIMYYEGTQGKRLRDLTNSIRGLYSEMIVFDGSVAFV